MLISLEIVDPVTRKPAMVALNPDNITKVEPCSVTPNHVQSLVHMRGGGVYASTQSYESILERLREFNPVSRILILLKDGVIHEVRTEAGSMACQKVETAQFSEDGVAALVTRYPVSLFKTKPRKGR